MRIDKPISTPPGFPNTYIYTRPGHSACAVCDQEFAWPKTWAGGGTRDKVYHEWHEIVYCSTGCYTRDLVKALPAPRKVIKVVIPVDRLPDTKFPCSQCGETFTPGPGSYWIQADGIQGGVVIPVCSTECKEGYEVREALAAEAEDAKKRSAGKVSVGGTIRGQSVTQMILDDPSLIRNTNMNAPNVGPDFFKRANKP